MKRFFSCHNLICAPVFTDFSARGSFSARESDQEHSFTIHLSFFDENNSGMTLKSMFGNDMETSQDYSCTSFNSQPSHQVHGCRTFVSWTRSSVCCPQAQQAQLLIFPRVGKMWECTTHNLSESLRDETDWSVLLGLGCVWPYRTRDTPHASPISKILKSPKCKSGSWQLLSQYGQYIQN